MSIARPDEIHEGHPLQPVIRKPSRVEKLEAGDRDTAVVQISNEIDAARNRVLPFASYQTEEPADESEEVAD